MICAQRVPEGGRRDSAGNPLRFAARRQIQAVFDRHPLRRPDDVVGATMLRFPRLVRHARWLRRRLKAILVAIVNP
jgi:hypothetical protein